MRRRGAREGLGACCLESVPQLSEPSLSLSLPQSGLPAEAPAAGGGGAPPPASPLPPVWARARLQANKHTRTRWSPPFTKGLGGGGRAPWRSSGGFLHWPARSSAREGETAGVPAPERCLGGRRGEQVARLPRLPRTITGTFCKGRREEPGLQGPTGYLPFPGGTASQESDFHKCTRPPQPSLSALLPLNQTYPTSPVPLYSCTDFLQTSFFCDSAHWLGSLSRPLKTSRPGGFFLKPRLSLSLPQDRWISIAFTLPWVRGSYQLLGVV